MPEFADNFKILRDVVGFCAEYTLPGVGSVRGYGLTSKAAKEDLLNSISDFKSALLALEMSLANEISGGEGRSFA